MSATLSVWISPSGSDIFGTGSSTSPYFSPHRARDAIRSTRGSSRIPATVYLGGGVYHLGRLGALELNSSDSHVQWVLADPTDTQPILSGTISLGALDWTVSKQSVLVATLPQLPQFTTLFEDGQATRRLIRARHPNGTFVLPEYIGVICLRVCVCS